MQEAAINNVADVASNLNDITFNSEANKAAVSAPCYPSFNHGPSS